jgi:FtsP/CotA-like multicopper oxidase with cupredoxin domain
MIASSAIGRACAAAAALIVCLSAAPRGQMPMPSRPVAAPAAAAGPGRTRTYFIAADEVRWDYAPHGRNLTGAPVGDQDSNESPASTTFWKAIYREYTDDTFRTPAPRAPEWEHLGLLGPVIRAEVGDTVRVVFRNNTNIFSSMHPHGLAYDKRSEGALYNDDTPEADKVDDRVPPGQTYTYTWTVPPRAGPAAGDPSSILWMYHSHFTEAKEMNTGLMGPIIVSARGTTLPDGRPKDVDREFVVAMAVFDETASAYFERNLAALPAPPPFASDDPRFRQRFLMFSINGFIDGNLPVMTMKEGERVRWYVMSNSNGEDVHAAHWHGQTVTVNNMRSDTVSVGPMAMAIADMVPDAVGTWLFHCHVNDHFEGGMQALFRVLPAGT